LAAASVSFFVSDAYCFENRVGELVNKLSAGNFLLLPISPDGSLGIFTTLRPS